MFLHVHKLQSSHHITSQKSDVLLQIIQTSLSHCVRRHKYVDVLASLTWRIYILEVEISQGNYKDRDYWSGKSFNQSQIKFRRYRIKDALSVTEEEKENKTEYQDSKRLFVVEGHIIANRFFNFFPGSPSLQLAVLYSLLFDLLLLDGGGRRRTLVGSSSEPQSSPPITP